MNEQRKKIDAKTMLENVMQKSWTMTKKGAPKGAKINEKSINNNVKKRCEKKRPPKNEGGDFGSHFGDFGIHFQFPELR